MRKKEPASCTEPVHLSFAHLSSYPITSIVCKSKGVPKSKPRLCSPPAMNHFAFQSIQSLQITEEDKPNIDVTDGQLVLTATRGGNKIMITAPLDKIIPRPMQTTVNANPTIGRTYKRARGRMMPTTCKNVGKNNSNAKLSVAKVKEIKLLLSDNNFINSYPSKTAMHRELARCYEVNASCIYQIDNNLTWKHVSI